eukprot:CAMPEP_0177202184 /NCGR_PEP_ID=MMETSP0367-20130122/27154_1 /TAXON_ID=447022 ORGANISM="Scrippsiella hangoei-like, Strain SHHI-4" /NCGR_SAMPLE_ID=MMETSP0367 /ASSEMBLY_ACC=CAM_ASM_000362 /LENGTH=160 /DNA_ID=CAMNT_0018650747 /DNA_START=60 /DNA_END=539 /DNA_ORIENTATION=+
MKAGVLALAAALFAGSTDAAAAIPPQLRRAQQAVSADLEAVNRAQPADSKVALTQLYAKKPRDLLPIGEGAYQDPKAVEQRTTDSNKDCEEGNVHGCYHADGADIVDGHSYGHLAGKSDGAGVAAMLPTLPPMPSLRSGASAPTTALLAVTAAVVAACVA